MKKNFMMRAASVLLVAVMLTTCAISGTFAKYITADDANDSARVAKFGVVVTADGSLFEENYINAPENDEDAATVVADTISDVVAPGTNNKDDAFTFSITGKPEVDVRIDVAVTTTQGDVVLKAGTYEDYTTGDDDDFTLAEDYYPVKYSLTKNGNAVVTDGTLADLVTALGAIKTTNVPANTDLSTVYGAYEISWRWDFEGAQTLNKVDFDAETVDAADTLLGNLAADYINGTDTFSKDVSSDKYNLSTGLSFEITVTQID